MTKITTALHPFTGKPGFSFKWDDGVVYGPWIAKVNNFYLCNDGTFAREPWKVDCRRRVIQHGYYPTREAARTAVRRYKTKNLVMV
jgi:hypothetical protein